jgi:hypothetical protein
MLLLQTLLAGDSGVHIPLAMHWYGWNVEGFDTMYPHYTVRPGVAADVYRCSGWSTILQLSITMLSDPTVN